MIGHLGKIVRRTSTISQSILRLQQDYDDIQPDPTQYLEQDFSQLQSQITSFIQQKSQSTKQKTIQFKHKIQTKIEALKEKSKSSKFIRTRDKVSFLLNTFRILLAFFILGRFPCFYPTFHWISALILLSARAIYYRYTHMHYYLLQFCYYGNILTILFLEFYPYSQIFYCIVFAFTFGPMLLAVMLFRNSLVPHSLEMMTSNYIHLAPALAVWNVANYECQKYPFHQVLPLVQYLGYSVLAYFVWCLPYYVWMFILTKDRQKQRNYGSLYQYAMESKSISGKLPKKFEEKWRPLVFVLQHFGMSVVMFLFSYFVIGSFVLMTGVLSFAGGVSVWNGANYYVEYFSKHYDKQFMALEDLAKKLND